MIGQQRETMAIALVTGLAILTFIKVFNHPEKINGWPPKSKYEAAQIQQNRLALKPGDTFKGRSITLLRGDDKGPIKWYPDVFEILYFNYRVPFGYDFTNDARNLGVPTANEYGHWISPTSLSLLAAAAYDSRDPIGRAFQVPRVYRRNLAQLIGVSLIVSDTPITGARELFRDSNLSRPLYLYETPDPNVGDYSPIETILARDAHNIFDILQSPGFDGRRTAVIEQPLPVQALVPVYKSFVEIKKGPIIRVHGESPKVSLLALPFDWSHCLKVQGVGLRTFVPVNLGQSGLLVEGKFDVDIQYRFGMLSGFKCRKMDLERARTLDLENAATGRLFRDSRPPS